MPRSSAICCSKKCWRNPNDDQVVDDEDTWMEPCRSKKSKRRQIIDQEVEQHAGDESDPSVSIDGPLLGDDDSGESGLEKSNNINEESLLQDDFMNTQQIVEHESFEEDGDNISASATAQINNNNITTENEDPASSSIWGYLYPFSSGQPPVMDAMDILGKETVRGLKGTRPAPPRRILDGMKNRFAKSPPTGDGSVTAKERQAISLIVTLENGIFLTASKSDRYIEVWRVCDNHATTPFQTNDSEDVNNNNTISTSNDGVEFIYDFKGHVSGVTTLVKFDKRGRFLSASLDKTVKLWEINTIEGGVADRPHLLATFRHLDKRWIKCMVPLDEGSFVRSTDTVNMSMVTAMVKKSTLEGHHATSDRSIVECSGTFATSSLNGRAVKIWEMSTVDTKIDDSATSNNKDVSKVCLVQELQHDVKIDAVEASEDGYNIYVGDLRGDIFLWSKPKSMLTTLGVTKSKGWELIRKFTWRGDDRVHVEGVFQHSITSLCFLGGSTLLSGTKEGVVQIWDITDMTKLQTVRVAEQPVSHIRKFLINEPNTMGFVVCCDGGQIVALTIQLEGGDVIELDAFPLSCTKAGDETRMISTIEPLSLPTAGNNRSISLIVGSDKGVVRIHQSELA